MAWGGFKKLKKAWRNVERGATAIAKPAEDPIGILTDPTQLAGGVGVAYSAEAGREGVDQYVVKPAEQSAARDAAREAEAQAATRSAEERRRSAAMEEYRRKMLERRGRGRAGTVLGSASQAQASVLG